MQMAIVSQYVAREGCYNGGPVEDGTIGWR